MCSTVIRSTEAAKGGHTTQLLVCSFLSLTGTYWAPTVRSFCVRSGGHNSEQVTQNTHSCGADAPVGKSAEDIKHKNMM